MYDFSVCKLCQRKAAVPTYRLKETTVFICAECGFHYINYLDTVYPGSESSLDQQSRDYIERVLGPNRAQQQINLALVKKFCVVEGQRCLDVGAGAGLFCRLMADSGAVAEGLEPQKIFREFAAQKFQMALSAKTLDHPQWLDSARAYDILTIFDVLEHVNFPRELIESAHFLLKSGGWLFLDTPCRDSIFYRLSELSWRLSGGRNALLLDSLYSPRPFRHKQIFSRRQLIELLKCLGFSVVRGNSPSLLSNKLVLVCRKN